MPYITWNRANEFSTNNTWEDLIFACGSHNMILVLSVWGCCCCCCCHFIYSILVPCHSDLVTDSLVLLCNLTIHSSFLLCCFFSDSIFLGKVVHNENKQPLVRHNIRLQNKGRLYRKNMVKLLFFVVESLGPFNHLTIRQGAVINEKGVLLNVFSLFFLK